MNICESTICVFQKKNPEYNWWFIQKCRLCNTGLCGMSVLLGLSRWWGDSGGLVCTQSRKTLNYKNTSYYYLESWYNGSVLLANLLDVNTGPGKNIHQLRVLSALLITVPKTEISIVSPCVYLCWVCNEKANSWKHSLICAYCAAWCRTTKRTSGIVPNHFLPV